MDDYGFDWFDSEIPDTVIKRQNLIRALIPGFVHEGYSLTRARQAFRDAGFSFGNSWFSEAWYSIESGYNQAEAIRILDFDINIPSALLKSWDQPGTLNTRYSFIFRVQTFDSTTEKYGWRSYRYDTNFLGTKDDLFDDAIDYILHGDSPVFGEVTEYDIERGYINWDMV